MLFGFIIFVLIVVIAYFHYLQGLFSATLSAIFAILAAVLAVSYQEPLERLLSRGGLADYATALTLVALFAGIYLILRLVFDNLVPGNIRFPLLVDRIGAAVMGAVAGLFAAGILSIAAQALPFGPSIAMYTPYTLNKERDVKIPPSRKGQYQFQDVWVTNELKSDRFNEEERNELFPAVDHLVLGTVQHLSDGGTLAGRRTLHSVHPDYLQELFGSRLGVQVRAMRTAINDGRNDQVRVVGAYLLEHPPEQIDAEIEQIRKRELPSILKVEAGEAVVVVRALFTSGAADKEDSLVRMSPGSVRLVLKEGDEYNNNYPIGTMERHMLLANRVDDALFVRADKAADFVFKVNRSALAKGPDGSAQFPQGVFFEAKRLGRVDLSNTKLQEGVKREDYAELGVLRKPDVLKKVPGAPAPAE